VELQAQQPEKHARREWKKRLDECPYDFLPANEAGELASLYGIPVPKGQLTQSEAEAVSTAEELGYPVALKIISPDLPHKTEHGGIVLGCMTEGEVRRGYQRLIANVSQITHAKVSGVLVEQMAAEGLEVILGTTRDDQFGTLLMFGAGGIEVELQQDVSFALTPLTDHDIQDLFASTDAGKRLVGLRGLAPKDQLSLRRVMAQLVQLSDDFPSIRELEINPLRVYPQGEGVLALDVRIRLEKGI
jgi:acetyltransferase